MASYVVPDEQPPRITPAVRWIVGINVAIYFLQITLFFGSGDAVARAFGFAASDFPGHWWKAITYMFVHDGVLHLAANMYVLWLFGTRVEHAWSPGAFVRFYLMCGLGGWLAHLLFVRTGTLVGASGAIYGVMLAYAVRWPDEEMFLFGVLPVKVKWLVTGYVMIDVVLAVIDRGSTGGVAHLAHLGGAATGWVYLHTRAAQGLDRLRPRVAQAPDVPDETPRAVPRSLPRPRERVNEIDDIVARSKAIAPVRRPAPVPRPAAPAPRPEQAIDLVLDKISRTGLDSLTSEERRVLEDASKKLRRRD
jgi:membrane associated rhomboid family serine protease